MTISSQAGPPGLEVLAASQCGGSSCPTIYRAADPGSLVVQGFAMTSSTTGITVPEGEQLVRIPVDLLRRAAQAIG